MNDPAAPTRSNPLAILFAADLESSAQSVLTAGGTITTPAFESPGGRRVHFTDPTDLALAVWNDRRVNGSVIA